MRSLTRTCMQARSSQIFTPVIKICKIFTGSHFDSTDLNKSASGERCPVNVQMYTIRLPMWRELQRD